MTGMAIAIEGLVKSYGKVEALRGLTLDVPRGSVCGFLGRNGAGKTSTLKILFGMMRPDAGRAAVLGHRVDLEAESIRIRQRAGFVSENKELYPYMTVSQAIRFTRGFYPRWRKDIEEKLIRMFELPLGRKVHRLSKGTRTKLMLLLVLCRGVELLVLDEPTEGLDPAATEELLQFLMGLAAEQEITVFFSSHQLSEVEQIADRVCIIEGGRTVVNDSLDELRSSYRKIHMVFDALPQEPFSFDGVKREDRNGRTVSLLVNRNAEAVIERVRDFAPRSMDVQPVTLKEIFLETTVRGRA